MDAIKQCVLESEGKSQPIEFSKLADLLDDISDKLTAKGLWTYGAIKTTPGAGDELITVTVPSGLTLEISGYFISAGEANAFKLKWTDWNDRSHEILIPLPSAGMILVICDAVAINQGIEARAEAEITIEVVNAAGAFDYQAGLLVRP